MITKDDLASFILQVLGGQYDSDDWERIAVNHYADEKMEDARRELVRYGLGYAPSKEEEHLSLRDHLTAIAATLKNENGAEPGATDNDPHGSLR